MPISPSLLIPSEGSRSVPSQTTPGRASQPTAHQRSEHGLMVSAQTSSREISQSPDRLQPESHLTNEHTPPIEGVMTESPSPDRIRRQTTVLRERSTAPHAPQNVFQVRNNIKRHEKASFSKYNPWGGHPKDKILASHFKKRDIVGLHSSY